MKAYYLLAALGVALLTGCTVYPPVSYTTAPATVAYTTPYVAPGYSVVVPRY